jgi:hypothetical protein
LAALLVGTGRPTEAIALLEAALPLLADAHQAETRARARAWLARALWPSGRDRDRARMLADQARHDLPMDSDERAELEAWLAGLP